MSDIKRLKEAADYALSDVSSDLRLAKFCIENEPSESNKEFLRIKEHNYSVLDQCIELLETIIEDEED